LNMAQDPSRADVTKMLTARALKKFCFFDLPEACVNTS